MSISKQLWDENIRIEEIFHLDTQFDFDPVPDRIREAFEDDWDFIWKALGFFTTEDDWSSFEEDPNDFLYDAFRHKEFSGFLVCVSTPVPREFNAENSDYMTSGFGFYHNHWIHRETLVEVYKAALEWKPKYIEEVRQKELAGTK